MLACSKMVDASLKMAITFLLALEYSPRVPEIKRAGP
jgi:hypothetical protein